MKKFSNWKTTICGIASGLGLLMTFYPQARPEGAIVAALGIAIQGYFTKDKDCDEKARAGKNNS